MPHYDCKSKILTLGVLIVSLEFQNEANIWICEILLMLKIIHRSLSTAVLRTFCQLVCDVVNDSILIMHKETTNTEGNFESRIK